MCGALHKVIRHLGIFQCSTSGRLTEHLLYPAYPKRELCFGGDVHGTDGTFLPPTSTAGPNKAAGLDLEAWEFKLDGGMRAQSSLLPEDSPPVGFEWYIRRCGGVHLAAHWVFVPSGFLGRK